MKVYVVISKLLVFNQWGAYDCSKIQKVFSSYEAAYAYCDNLLFNKERISECIQEHEVIE